MNNLYIYCIKYSHLPCHLCGYIIQLTIFISIFSVNSKSISQNSICTSSEINQHITDLELPWKRAAIVRKLIRCKQSAVPALINILRTEVNPTIREDAVMSLGYIGGSTTTEALINTLKNDLSSVVRKTAADALGEIRSAEAVGPLIITLKDLNEDIYVRQSAAESLGNMGDIEAINPLIEILQNTIQPMDLRLISAQALAKIGDSGVEKLKILIKESDLQTQYWSVMALIEINSSRSLNILTVNQKIVNQILEDANQSRIISSYRVPPNMIYPGRQIPQRPIICQFDWIAQYWGRCW